MMDLGKWAAEEYRLPEQGPSVSDDSAEKASKER